MTKAKGKPVFAPIPARAMLDERLAARHWRTLAVIAVHDRLGANGIGCWARQERLARMAGCSYQRWSENTKDLGEWGYLERHPHPLNKKLRVYRIVYTAEDAESLKEAKNDTLPDGEQFASPDGEQSAPDSSPNGVADKPDSSPPDTRKPAENSEKPSVNIFRETVNRSCRSKERNSPEGAPPSGGALSAKDDFQERRSEFGAYCARIERRLNEDDLPAGELRSIAEQLDYIAGWICDTNDSVFQHARRLQNDVTFKLAFER